MSGYRCNINFLLYFYLKSTRDFKNNLKVEKMFNLYFYHFFILYFLMDFIIFFWFSYFLNCTIFLNFHIPFQLRSFSFENNWFFVKNHFFTETQSLIKFHFSLIKFSKIHRFTDILWYDFAKIFMIPYIILWHFYILNKRGLEKSNPWER